MNNFKSGPGGLRGRKEYIGGRPKLDADYSTKKKDFGGKPKFAGKGGFKKDFKQGGDRGGSRGGFGGGRSGDRGGFGGSRDGGRREVSMHKATCSECGKPCEVPFRPDGSKPVLCSECFGMAKTDARNGTDRRERFSNDRPKRAYGEEKTPRTDGDFALLTKQIAVLEEKLNEVIGLIRASVIVTEEMAEEVEVEVKKTVKKAAAKKAAPAKKVAPKKTIAKKVAPKKVVVKKVVAKK